MSSQQDVITPLRITIRDLKASFDSLVNAERALGFNEREGTTADLIAASAAIEHIINNELTWVGDHDSASAVRIAAHHAALRSRISPQPVLSSRRRNGARRRAAFPRRDQTLQRHLRFGRRPAGGEAEAQQGGADLQLHVRPVGRQHRQHRTAADADQPRYRERAARGRQIIAAAQQQCRGRRERARRVTRPHPVDHRLGRLRLRHAGAGRRLADRPLRHDAAGGTCRGDEAACRRRHHGAHPGDRFPPRDRRHGARRRGVPRQHDRARTAVRRAGRRRHGARAARRSHRRDDRAIPHLGRRRAGAAARIRKPAWKPPRAACIRRPMR